MKPFESDKQRWKRHTKKLSALPNSCKRVQKFKELWHSPDSIMPFGEYAKNDREKNITVDRVTDE